MPDELDLIHEAEMIRRCATACRNFRRDNVHDLADCWFDWVPQHLDALAERIAAAGPSVEETDP